MRMARLQRRAFLGRALLGIGLLSAGLMARPVTGVAQDAAANPAAAPIQKLNDALIHVMQQGKSVPFTQRFNELAPTVEATFDVQQLVRGTVGFQWSSLPPARQQELMAAYERYAVASYVANFDSFSGQSFRILPNGRTLPSGEQVVPTELVPGNGGKPVRIDYVMRQTDDGWKAVDVLLDGSISRVAVERSDFASLLSDHTGAALLAKLQQKVSDLSGGEMA